MIGSLTALFGLGLVAGVQCLSLHNPPEQHPLEYYYGTPYKIAKGNDANFPLFPNLTNCPPGSITACCHDDGFGATWTAMLSVYNYARTHNITFCATAFGSLDHGTTGGDMFSFIGGRIYGPKPRGNARRFNQKCSQILSPQVREEARHFYWKAAEKTPKPNLTYFHDEGKGSMRFVWHVRRGDVTDGKCLGCEWRLLTDAQIKRGLTALKSKYRSKLETVHLITDGRPAEFGQVIQSCNQMGVKCKLHAGNAGDIKTDFHHMVMADVLVMAHSTLSGMAGVISTNEVYDAHELADSGGSPRARMAEPVPLSDEGKAKHLWMVQTQKARHEAKDAEMIGPVGHMCADDPRPVIIQQ